jgi:hypothetical protein
VRNFLIVISSSRGTTFQFVTSRRRALREFVRAQADQVFEFRVVRWAQSLVVSSGFASMGRLL